MQNWQLGLRKIVFGRNKPIIRDSSIKAQLIKLLIVLLLVLLLHSLTMVWFEHLPVLDAVWLSITSATTVGYGDYSAQTLAGRLATIILLYIGGIAILAQVASMYFEYRQEIRNRILKGDWSWSMDNHIVFLNSPEEVGEEYFYQAISQLRASSAALGSLPIVIVSEKLENGISDKLRELDVVHVSKPITDDDALALG